ncbi:MAG: riboflavin synthase [Candidatus Tantalella remota]|nr:riboflavin synthase [Candidatus Tantalella remota]
MFTGIILETGNVKRIARRGDSYRLDVDCKKISEGLAIGESVAVNGVCLSVVENKKGLSFDVVENTVKSTNLKRITPGDKVNLEPALKAGDMMSGHMVSGHVDGEYRIKSEGKTAGGWVVDVSFARGDEKYLVPKGSVAIDGISLTVGEVHSSFFRIFLIPHTLENTTLKLKKNRDYVNVEFDMMGKYAGKKENGSSITKDMLIEKGFM